MTQQNSFHTQLSSLFMMSRDAVLGLEDHVVVWANPAADELFGHPVAGGNIRDILPTFPPDSSSDYFVFSAEVNGKIVSVACTRSESAQLVTIPLDTVLADIPFHALNDIRSSVFNLKLAADQLVSHLVGSLDPKVGAQAAMLYHNYYSVLRMLGNLSTTGAIAENDLHLMKDQADLGRICSQLTTALQPYAKKKDLTLEFRCDAVNTAAVLDQSRIEQLLLNLVSNSMQHTPPGGKITLSLTRQGNYLALYVADNGEGIPPEKLADVFSFHSQSLPDTKPGAGMGLYIARGIAQSHGGRLLINSRVGKGTTVQVLLPADTTPRPLNFRDAGRYKQETKQHFILTELSGVLSSDSYIPLYFQS
ncbi:MAG: ATP-binding protein [Eubacteriales bacterium]|nr:ATP-binding protein [Eubacteriales bacterium]